MTSTKRTTSRAGLLGAALLLYALLGAAAASATQILVGADHAELPARVAADGVSRVALVGDRVARVIRAPGGFEVEHDPVSGDLYLRPLAKDVTGEPVALFVGSERGFTYRLALTPVEGGPAQILIRNPELANARAAEAAPESDPRIAAIARLVRAVASREPLSGYAIEVGGGEAHGIDTSVVEVWRGPRFTALVLALGPRAPSVPAVLAERLGPDVAAVWLAEPGAGPADSRLAVAVRDGGSR